MRILILAALIFSLNYSSAHEAPAHSRYQILVTDPTTSTVTEESFGRIPSFIFSQNYQEFIANKQSVKMNLEWKTPYFSAWVTDNAPGVYTISIWGGLARIPGMNDNGLAMVMCHEIGHLLGGEPRSKLPAFLWASSEGQSDYYASSICLKRHYSLLEKLGKLEEPKVERTLYTRCLKSYAETKDFLICLNIMDGIKAFSKMLDHLNPEGKKTSLQHQSPAAKSTNFNSYPDPQCRIETLIAGNFCSIKDYPCLKGTAARPHCWYVNQGK